MNRDIDYALRKFSSLPSSLNKSGTLSLPLKSVCHQMYLDIYGNSPPNPNPFV